MVVWCNTKDGGKRVQHDGSNVTGDVTLDGGTGPQHDGSNVTGDGAEALQVMVPWCSTMALLNVRSKGTGDGIVVQHEGALQAQLLDLVEGALPVVAQ